jgi:hypothetical protein
VRTGTVSRRELVPPEVASRILRRRYFYLIEEAGKKIGLTRTPAYVAARTGMIPTERYGKLLLVRKTIWDAEVRRLKRGN